MCIFNTPIITVRRFIAAVFWLMSGVAAAESAGRILWLNSMCSVLHQGHLWQHCVFTVGV